jgi:hypothetical protein
MLERRYAAKIARRLRRLRGNDSVRRALEALRTGKGYDGKKESQVCEKVA